MNINILRYSLIGIAGGQEVTFLESKLFVVLQFWYVIEKNSKSVLFLPILVRFFFFLQFQSSIFLLSSSYLIFFAKI